MKKRIKMLSGNKGVTLVELIVSMFVLSLIMVAVTTVFAPMLRTYERANNLAEANTLLDNISVLVMDDIANATSITQTGAVFAVVTTHRITYEVVDGVLTRSALSSDQIPVLDPGFYRNSRIEAGLASTGGLVTLTLRLISNDGWELERDYTIRPVGLAG